MTKILCFFCFFLFFMIVISHSSVHFLTVMLHDLNYLAVKCVLLIEVKETTPFFLTRPTSLNYVVISTWNIVEEKYEVTL